MSALGSVRAHWQSASAREQRWLLAGSALLVLALLWWVALAPALRALKAAPQQHLALDAQMQVMQRLQAQAQTLRAQPVISAAQARKSLDGLLKPLGASVQMVFQADRVTITLKGVSPEVLAQLLAGIRQGARMVPSEAHLTRNVGGVWDGSLILQLPLQ
jgi:general secretion pathway protein M